MPPLLSVNITVDYPGRPGVLKDLSLEINDGEIVGLAGQSGSGKSTLAMSIIRLLPERSRIQGSILFRGQNLLECPPAELRRIRGRHIGVALQAASSALNPHLRIETQLKEVWKAHETRPWSHGRDRTLELLEAMDLKCERSFLRRYPGEVSIGQAQRIVLAMALIHRPSLLIADEPTSALDLISQEQLLRLLRKLNQAGTTMLYISHDLGTVGYLCHRISVLSNGMIVESGTPESVFRKPHAEFTRQLIGAQRALSGLTSLPSTIGTAS